MTDLLQFLSQNPQIATSIAIGISFLVMAVVLLFIIAFVQGREITFWPPKIGPQVESSLGVGTSNKTIFEMLRKAPNRRKPIKFPTTFDDNHPISYVTGWKSLEHEIAYRLRNSTDVQILQVKGRDLYLVSPIKQAIMARSRAGKLTKILLQSSQSRYINEKISTEFEWASFEKYVMDFDHTLTILSDVIHNYEQYIRTYDFLPLLRLYIFDDVIFVSIYSGRLKDRNHEEIPVWCLARKTDKYDIVRLIERYYEALWKESHVLSLIQNKSVVFESETYFLSIPVSSEKVINLKKEIRFRNKAFLLKKEFHITIIGSNLLPLIKEKMEFHPVEKDSILRAIAETNWNYELTNRYHHLVEERGDHNGDSQATNRRESIIQLVDVPELDNFYKKLELVLGFQIPSRPCHITLYTFGGEQGISVNTLEELAELNHGAVNFDQLNS